MSPWVVKPVQGGSYVGSAPINQGRVATPASTLMQVDSVWDRAGGAPKGGGNWVVEAPCVRINGTADGYLEPISEFRNSTTNTWRSYGGWQPGTQSWLEFGGCWPWFNKRFHVGYFDGHVGTMALGRLVDGCDVRSGFTGLAYDGDKYLWDLR